MDIQRDKPVTMICVCRLKIAVHPDALFQNIGHDSCSIHTSGPDEPVCQWCVAAGHDKQDNFDPTIKTVSVYVGADGLRLEVVNDART